MTAHIIVSFSPLWWATISAPLANHLWQSTLFVGVVRLLVLLLRKNHAQTRYWVWLAASAKFLIPFPLLVGLGNYLGWSIAPAMTQSSFSFAVQEISRPFAPAEPSYAALAASTVLAEPARLLPTLVLAVWFFGCAAVLFSWWLRWRRMTAAIRSAMPVKSGPELEALRRLEPSVGIKGQIELIVSSSALEPGILGIFRPVLLLPAGISGRLTDVQLDAIITHELCHVRRRDNLAAALHMLVEAIFWFHPIVWWIGTRLVDERERACDEEVLKLGNEPQVYAEGILKVCELYLESPLFCAAGVTGSNLKKRIEAIMTHRAARNLDLGKKILLATIGATAVVAPVVFGLLQPTQSRAHSQLQGAVPAPIGFGAVTIKPNKTGEPMAGFTIKADRPGTGAAVSFKPDRFAATNFTLHMLIRLAYGVQDDQISGGPDWVGSERFDVEAMVGSAREEELRKLGPDQRHLEQLRMIQALLADRFKLELHRETKEVPAYVMVIAKNGSKLHEAKPGDTYSNGPKANGHPIGGGTMEAPEGKLLVQGLPIKDLAQELSRQLGRPVLDKSGLKGVYDFTLDLSATGILTALPQQLGLELKPETAPVEMLVIDHAERVPGDEKVGAARVN